MAQPRKLTEDEIVDLLEVDDDDDLDTISVDDDDGDSDGPEEFEEIVLLQPHTQLPSPGSQDMFADLQTPAILSPATQQLVDDLPSPSPSQLLSPAVSSVLVPPIDELPSPTASPSKGPPAKRRRIQSRPQPNSGK